MCIKSLDSNQKGHSVWAGLTSVCQSRYEYLIKPEACGCNLYFIKLSDKISVESHRNSQRRIDIEG